VRHRDEKVKDVQRSVLPSTARRAARAERRAIHKRQRVREGVLLAELRSTPDADLDFRDGRAWSAIHWMVADRRGADKIGPLTRWAVATVNADPELRDAAWHEQVAYFAALLPGTMIGRHAVRHIEWALRYHDHTWPDWAGRAKERRETQVAQVLADARRIIDSGRHAELNKALRKEHQALNVDGATALPPVRMLMGIHDLDAFTADVAALDWVRVIVARVARRATEPRDPTNANGRGRVG